MSNETDASAGRSAMHLAARFEAAWSMLPLVAILRGLTTAEAVPAGRVLYEAGFRFIEVPLNSPEPFESIARLRQALPAEALVGAGTVMHAEQVARLRAIDAELVVMPHADVAVIAAAKAHGRLCMPGVATPTEAFAALAAGADALKLFPAELVTPRVIKALRAVLPPTVRLLPVGGITPASMAEHIVAGANGFGLGSALYTPGLPLDDLAQRAHAFVTAWRALPPR
jgi:2-dehydro-3-deoxyphosphogalactonate aldolase